jgi:CRP-like cAMP-binding protein
MKENLERILADHPFAKGLDDRSLKLLAGCAKNVRFEAGKFLFREGEEANHFYLIRKGVVAVEVYAGAAGPLNVTTIGEGEVLGWSWLFPPYRWKFDARAKELTRALALDGKCLRKKCEADHDLGYELLKRFAYMVEQRLESTRLQLLDVYGSNA